MSPLLSTPIPEICVLGHELGEQSPFETFTFTAVLLAGLNSPIYPENPSLYQIFPLPSDVIRCGRFLGLTVCSVSLTVPLVVGAKLPILGALFSANQIFP